MRTHVIPCDTCHESYPDSEIYLDDLGRFGCSYCLGFKEPHPVFMIEGKSVNLEEISATKARTDVKHEGS